MLTRARLATRRRPSTSRTANQTVMLLNQASVNNQPSEFSVEDAECLVSTGGTRQELRPKA